MKKVLVVDDEKNSRELVCEVLEDLGLKTCQAASAAEALAKINGEALDLVITDMRMPGGSGMEVVMECRRHPGLPAIVVTGYGSPKEASEALAQGALDFLEKPLDLPTLEAKVKGALHLDREGRARNNYGLIGESQAMLEVIETAEQFAYSKATVLLEGESGTGKEVVAHAIHEAGPRKNEPFVAVNCSNFTDTLLQSELFGHEKGAFTGATEQHKGKFEIAGQGTLFLDEIGTIPPHVQVALLRVLDARTFERVGGNQTIECKARIVTATNESLWELVKAKRFREDLYNRLHVLHMVLPPLRMRTGDVKVLAEYFLEKFNREEEKNVRISQMAMGILEKYSWPGNVRELQNTILALVAGSMGGEITPGDLPARIKAPESQEAKKADPWEAIDSMTLDEIEMELIRRKLAKGKTKSQVSKELGISRRSLYRVLPKESAGTEDK